MGWRFTKVQFCSGGGYPDFSNSTTITASGFKCPSNGWICISLDGRTHGTNTLSINGTMIAAAYAENQYQESPVHVQVPVKKDDIITWVGTLRLGIFLGLR